MLILREGLRKYLAAPRGVLYTGNSVRKLMQKLDPKKTITVGDVVTKEFIRYRGEAPSVSFIDFKSERLRREEFNKEVVEKFNYVLKISNEQGTISREFILETLSEILALGDEDRVLVIVRGEEDLLPFITPYIKCKAIVYTVWAAWRRGCSTIYVWCFGAARSQYTVLYEIGFVVLS